jgi:hypothetical protein
MSAGMKPPREAESSRTMPVGLRVQAHPTLLLLSSSPIPCPRELDFPHQLFTTLPHDGQPHELCRVLEIHSTSLPSATARLNRGGRSALHIPYPVTATASGPRAPLQWRLQASMSLPWVDTEHLAFANSLIPQIGIFVSDNSD